MNVQTENGYTRIANELLEALMKVRLSSYEYAVALAVIRKTYGFKKKEDYIALTQITELTGIRKTHVSRSIKKLLTYSIVTKIGNKLKLNKDYSAWKVTKIGNSRKVTNLGNKKLPKEALQKKERKEDTNVSSGVDTPKADEKKKYGNEEINRILIDFERLTGHIPADKKPRNVAHNMNQLLNTFLKQHSGLFYELRGTQLTKDYVLEKFYLNIMQKKYFLDIEKLETIKLRMKVYLAEIAKKLEAEKKAKKRYLGIQTDYVPKTVN